MLPDPDVARAFKNAESVNAVWLALMRTMPSPRQADCQSAAGSQPAPQKPASAGVLNYQTVMAIPNVKRFRPFCPTCNDNFTLMVVLPQKADVNKYLADAVARHDHKGFQEAKTLHVKVRVGQQKQKKAK